MIFMTFVSFSITIQLGFLFIEWKEVENLIQIPHNRIPNIQEVGIHLLELNRQIVIHPINRLAQKFRSFCILKIPNGKRRCLSDKLRATLLPNHNFNKLIQIGVQLSEQVVRRNVTRIGHGLPMIDLDLIPKNHEVMGHVADHSGHLLCRMGRTLDRHEIGFEQPVGNRCIGSRHTFPRTGHRILLLLLFRMFDLQIQKPCMGNNVGFSCGIRGCFFGCGGNFGRSQCFDLIRPMIGKSGHFVTLARNESDSRERGSLPESSTDKWYPKFRFW